jgi:hypothetical protein
MTMFNTPVPALYSSDSGEVRVMMIGSDVSRVEYKMNVVMIKFNDESTQIVPEGHLDPVDVHKPTREKLVGNSIDVPCAESTCTRCYPVNN